MSIELQVEHIRDPSTWHSAYEWFGSKLAVIFGKLFPLLRDEMEAVHAVNAAEAASAPTS